MKLTNEKDIERRSRLIYSIYRPNFNLKRSDIAKAAGYTPEYISRLISGERRISDEAAKNLAVALNVRVEYLRAEDEYMTHEDFSKIMEQADNFASSINQATQDTGFLYLDAHNVTTDQLWKIPPEEDILSFITTFSSNNERYVVHIKEKKYIAITDDEYKALCDDITDFIQFKVQQLYKNHIPKGIPDSIA